MNLFNSGAVKRPDLFHPQHLSYSNLASYAECGERWRLERGHRIADHTWFATIAGTTLHEATAAYDTDGSRIDLHARFAELIAEEERPIRASKWGDRTKDGSFTPVAGPNGRDREWWEVYLPIYFERWVNFRQRNPDWVIPTLGGKLAVELEFEHVLDSGVKMLGAIDRVFFDHAAGYFFVLDLKFGQVPEGALQLATYGMLLERMFGIDVPFGGFWSPHIGTRSAKTTKEADAGAPFRLEQLTEIPNGYLDRLYAAQLRGVQNGVFIPNITPNCRGCGVRDFCRAVGGPLADEVPLGTTIIDRDTSEVLFQFD